LYHPFRNPDPTDQTARIQLTVEFGSCASRAVRNHLFKCSTVSWIRAVWSVGSGFRNPDPTDQTARIQLTVEHLNKWFRTAREAQDPNAWVRGRVARLSRDLMKDPFD
jgi:hypothetical protein